MKMKRIFAKDMSDALRIIREKLGDEAVIVSRKNIQRNGKNGIEVLAGVDVEQATLLTSSAAELSQSPYLMPQNNALVNTHTPSSVMPSMNSMAVQYKNAYQKTENDSHDKMTWAQEPALVSMQSELQVLRHLLEEQLNGFAWANASRQQPIHAWLFKKLRELDLPANFCRKIAETISDGTMEEAWQQAQLRVQHQLRIQSNDMIETGGIYALIGPTGAGKTTTIAKLAARCAIAHGADQVILLTTDIYRVAASEQLRTYGKLLGLKVLVVEDEKQLKNNLKLYKDKHLILIDTAGMSQRDIRLQQQLELLKHADIEIKNYLVLSATHQYYALHDAINTFSNITVDGVIVTKLDESSSLGAMVGILIEKNLPLMYLTDGQRVPEDLHHAKTQQVWQALLNVTKPQSENVEEKTLASDW